MNNFHIEKITESALIELQKISVKTFSDTYGTLNTASNMKMYLESMFNLRQLRSELKNVNSEFYFLVQSDEVTGYLKVNIGNAQTEQQSKNALEIERIYVKSEFKRKGFGKALIDKALEVAKNQRVENIWLGVWEKNTYAIAFYKKVGFMEFDKHTFLLGDDHQTDIMMRLKLNRVCL